MNKLERVLDSQGLTPREIEVCQLVSEGMSNQEVADDLKVALVTVKFHLQNIFKKMEIKSRAQLIVYCLPFVVAPSKVKAPPVNENNWINRDVEEVKPRARSKG